MSRHHFQSPTIVRVSIDRAATDYEMDWDLASEREKATYANEEDATCEAAYAVALAAAQTHLNLVAIRRSESRSGCDYYLSPSDSAPGELDFDSPSEELVRLEVSGIDNNDTVKMMARTKLKVEQIRAAGKPGSGIAAVVGFKLPSVMFRRAT